MRTRKCDVCGRERPYFALDEITDAGRAQEGPRTVCSDETECVPDDAGTARRHG